MADERQGLELEDEPGGQRGDPRDEPPAALPVAAMLSPASSSIKGVASESITYGPNMATLSAAQGRVQTQISAV